jgi:hypothetical protein
LLGAFLILEVRTTVIHQESSETFEFSIHVKQGPDDAHFSLQRNMTPEEAFHPFSRVTPYPFEDFRDATARQQSPHTLSLVLACEF